MMPWKKSKEKTTETPAVDLSPWPGLVQEILDYYTLTRHELVKLEKWDYRQLFAGAIQSSTDLKGGLSKLSDSFKEARSKELGEGKRYLTDIRGLLWSSIERICLFVEASELQAKPIANARRSLQKALLQDDLKAAKATIREVLAALAELDQSRHITMEQLHQHFKKQMTLLQTELQTAQKELQLDGLTQVYNRATFDLHIKKASQLAYLTGEKSCLIMFDIDHFKKVNDTFGHPAGDAVIQLFAKTIVQAFPRRGDFVARYGGEEFVVILQGIEMAQARELIAKLLVKVRGLKLKHGQENISFTASAGLAGYLSGEPAELWLSRADKALYKAKQLGRDRFIIADETG